MYNPQGANPYEIYSISGHILAYNVETRTLTDLTAMFPANVPQFNPPDEEEVTFCQGEQFLVIQAGDYDPVTNTGTLPFFWDGATLRRSNGFTGNVGPQPSATYNLNPTAAWVVPSVGGTVTVNLLVNYPGIVTDVGVYTNLNAGGIPLATFEVMATPANQVTFKTIATDYAGVVVYPYTQFGGATFTIAGTTPAINEIPSARYMDYFMGRIWWSQGRITGAGDIVGGNSGTAFYDFTDSILKVTENPAVIGGDGFRIPSNDGSNIRGIHHSANIDAALGQGRLFVGTTKAIYALNVPVTRNDWIAATNANQPLMTVVQLADGWVSDRSVVPVNGDLFYQSLEPAIRSLVQSTRFFGEWGNTSISANEQRILKYNDRSFLRLSSGMYVANRLYQTALPFTSDQGTASHALIPMDFMPISSFNKKVPPNWEGMYEGLDFFQVNTGDFGGRERAFVTVRSPVDQSIQIWEYIEGTQFDHSTLYGETRITWVVEFPAFTWGDENALKQLVGCELWVDRLVGTVQFEMQYRPDGQACWIPWHIWKKCSTRNSEENVVNPAAYPLVPCAEAYYNTMSLPKPSDQPCSTGRPSTHGYQFQTRLIVTGFCRVRGLYLHAQKLGRTLYQNLTC